jgi:hypothetical protein
MPNHSSSSGFHLISCFIYIGLKGDSILVLAVSKFKTMSKSVPVSHDGSLVHGPKWQIDAQVHGFPNRHLHGQCGRQSRLAHFY